MKRSDFFKTLLAAPLVAMGVVKAKEPSGKICTIELEDLDPSFNTWNSNPFIMNTATRAQLKYITNQPEGSMIYCEGGVLYYRNGEWKNIDEPGAYPTSINNNV